MNGRTTIEVIRNGQVAIVRLPEAVEISRIHETRKALIEAIDNRDHAVILDLGATGYLDSSGVNVLYELAESFGARQIRTAIVLPPGGLVERVVEIVDLGSTIPIFRDLDAALAEVRPA